MSRRIVLVTVFLLVVAVGIDRFRSAGRPAVPAAVKPSILLVVVDALRADHLPFMGYSRATAPFLTSLATRGVVFERAYSTSGWTVPAVASLFTSLYPPQHGVVKSIRVIRRAGGNAEQVQSLPVAIRTLPQVLRQAGYTTFAVVDNAIVSRRRGFDRGFVRFDRENNVGAAAMNARLLAWRNKLGRRPYFVYMHYNEAHAPYERHAPWFEEFAADGSARGGAAQEMAAYDSEIRRLDDYIRALYDALGWGRDTVVVVTADHGEAFGEHELSGHGSGLHAELLNVPLLVWDGSGRYAPRRVRTPVSHVDLLPTLRQIAGLPPDPSDEGRSLVPLLATGSGVDPQRTLFAYILPFGSRPEIKAVIEGRWKLILYAEGQPELFDIVADPSETANRLAGERATADRLAGVWRRFEEAAPRYEAKKRMVPIDPETEANLRAMGYIR